MSKKIHAKKDVGADSTDVSYVDFGAVFGDRSQVCDYTPCLDEISNFVPTIAGLLGREISQDEFSACERMLRNEYLAHGPFRTNRDTDDHIYKTPWEMPDGTRICVRAILRHLSSIKVENADKKLCGFMICDTSGQLIGTMRTLPWTITNIRSISYAMRSLFQGYFPHDLLGSRLVSGWLSAGGKDDLPLTIFLTELQDGSELSIRFSEDFDAGVEQHCCAKATILVDDVEIPIQELLPPMLRKINIEALDVCAMDSYYDMKGCLAEENYRDWLFVRLQRYDFLHTFQARYEGRAGILPAVLSNGECVEVFHTGDVSIDGEDVYGLCRDWLNGRWNSVLWVRAEHLAGIGINRLPKAPDWDLVWSEFDPSVAIGQLSRHVLHNAHRWVTREALSGRKDELGHDIFVSEEIREAMYSKACTELTRSVHFAAIHPERISYGYYHPSVDRALGEISPIAIYLPAFFSDDAKERESEDVVFAIRVVSDGGFIRYEVPTILPVEYTKRIEKVITIQKNCRERESVAVDAA